MSTKTVSRIENVLAREVLDSRGNPTVQADVYTNGGFFGRFTVPSGASKGRFEAYELRDADVKRYGGLGVRIAVANVTERIRPAVKGLDVMEQEKVDRVMLALDGTERKERLGANAILAVSIATARAAGNVRKISFHEYLSETFGNGDRPVLPMPMLNIINGGKHAGNDLAFQEFMILPSGSKTFAEALAAGSEVYHNLGKMLSRKYGKAATNVGDEGGYAPPIKMVREAVDMIEKSIQESGYTSREVVLGIDPASGSFYDEKANSYLVDGRKLGTGELYDLYVDLVRSYPLRSIEDPFHEEDFESFAQITKTLHGRAQIVGDDLFVTNAVRIQKGAKMGAASALLVKVNQAGTLTETMEAMSVARKSGFGLVMSHRSGDTEDTTIADLAVGFTTGQIKSGAPARGERTAKYNRLLEIEEELGSKAGYFGPSFLKRG